MIWLVPAAAIIISSSLGEMKDRLPARTLASIEQMGREISLVRPYRLQLALMKEDLVWLNRGYSERQIMIVQVIALDTSLKREPNEEEQKRIKYVDSNKAYGRKLVKKMLKELGDVTDRELRFHL
jgi:hypothetical protein